MVQTRVCGALLKSPDVRNAATGRVRPVAGKAVFRELTPLAQLNRPMRSLLPGSAKTGKLVADEVCAKQMLAMLNCFGKFDNDTSMCGKEVEAYESCFARFQAGAKEREARDKAFPVGERAALNMQQMRKLMDKFPQSSRQTRDYFEAFKK